MWSVSYVLDNVLDCEDADTLCQSVMKGKSNRSLPHTLDRQTDRHYTTHLIIRDIIQFRYLYQGIIFFIMESHFVYSLLILGCLTTMIRYKHNLQIPATHTSLLSSLKTAST